MADLGIAKTHSRPYVSNDNPYSESQFRTMKYRPGFPDRFGCIQDCRAFCQQFFTWYNDQHCHSGIALLTPSMVHFCQAPAVLSQRQLVLDAACLAHPERFVRKAPCVRCCEQDAEIRGVGNSEDRCRCTEKVARCSRSSWSTGVARTSLRLTRRTRRPHWNNGPIKSRQSISHTSVMHAKRNS